MDAKRIAAVLVLFLLTGAPASAQAPPIAAELCSKKENDALKIRACTELIKLDAKNSRAYMNRATAFAFLCQGNADVNCDNSLADSDTVLSLATSPPGEIASVHYWRGVVYQKMQDSDRALAAFTKAIEIGPEPDYGHYSARATLQTNRHDYKAAIPDYTKMLELKPQERYNLQQRAWAYMQDGDYARAIADYDTYFAVKPADNYDAALLARLKGLPPNADAATECAAELGMSRTIKACNDVLSKDPNSAAAYFHRANATLVGQEADALRDYDKAIALDPANREFYVKRAQTRQRIKTSDQAQRAANLQGAIADYTKAIELDANDAAVFASRAVLYSAFKDYERAISDVTNAIKLEPKNADHLCARAEIYEAAGDEKRAEADYKAADKLAKEKDTCT